MDPNGLFPRLPLRVVPYADESLAGLLVRLAERNCVRNAGALAKLLGSPHSTIEATAFGAFDLTPLASGTGVSLEALARMTYWPSGLGNQANFLGHSIASGMMSLHRRWVCPLCLIEVPYHRAVWDLRAINACPIHGVRLVDRCHNCDRPLVWRYSSITQCNCGADIRGAKPSHQSGEVLGGVRQVYRSFGFMERERLSGAIEHLSTGEFLSLILRLGWYASGFAQDLGPKLISRYREQMHLCLQRGVDACRDWPVSFHQYLDALREPVARPFWRPQGVHRLAKWSMDRQTSEPLQRLIMDELLEHLGGSLAYQIHFRAYRSNRAKGLGPQGHCSVPVGSHSEIQHI